MGSDLQGVDGGGKVPRIGGLLFFPPKSAYTEKGRGNTVALTPQISKTVTPQSCEVRGGGEEGHSEPGPLRLGAETGPLHPEDQEPSLAPPP